MKIAALIAAAAVALVCAPGTAHAGWKINRATAIAKIVWHHPCVDRMRLTWGPLDSDEEIGEAFADTCVVRLSDTRPLEWEEFCHTLLHETGHLAGMPHSDRGIMVPRSDFLVSRDRDARTGRVSLTILGADRRCRDRGRPFLEARDLLTRS